MILSCGEALIDMLPRTTAAGEAAFAPYAGGAVFNTAIALGRLGVPAGFFSGLSSDLFGDVLRDTLAASRVDASPSHVSARPTTLAFVRLTDGHATYTFYDENTAGRMLTEADLPDTDAEALFFGGISLVGEPCGTAYEALQAREAGARVTMIDPNIRPSFITDEAAYRDRIARMCARADIVKLSDEDLHWLRGSGTTEGLARDLLDAGARLVCITEGAKGATGYSAAHTVTVPATRVEVVDTVGAGDTFNAGVLASLYKAGALTKDRVAALTEDEIAAALSLGARAAAITVSRAGANPPWDHEV
ncbi:carbohydrate kinase family protein [Wenxinia marina]|uniref:Sugar kinase, ribokinase family n=1 Tax=Wenxinia marina DSM 24838 TaxID=1123501 RepID=A0A0D0QFE9_9RHOB|nr:carbohydrate kinase [Wenxinia marina]KIQ69688.1 Sugar kinase, ribokinase family [Wenxinia marina DSM 24838]GGL60407.1 carbohydrate kinase [Wenxinia marina]